MHCSRLESVLTMKITELEATFVRHEYRDDDSGRRAWVIYVDTIEEAQGVQFLCPLCWIKNNGRIGTHRIRCWSRLRGVPDDVVPKPGRWKLEGTGLDDLTLNGESGKSRSVLLTGDGCKWHGYITNGLVTNA